MPAPARHNIHLRVTPNVYNAMKRQADRDGLTLNRWIMETCLLRVGWALGVEAGRLNVGGDAVNTDEQIREAVIDLLSHWGEPEPRDRTTA
jgi:hypothetical protein